MYPPSTVIVVYFYPFIGYFPPMWVLGNFEADGFGWV